MESDSDRDERMRLAEDSVRALSHEMSRLQAEYVHNGAVLRRLHARATRPLEVQTYEAAQRRRWAEVELGWKRKILQNLPLPPGQRQDLTPEVTAFLHGLHADVTAAADALESLTPGELKILRDYTDPPPHLERPVRATLLAFGEEPAGSCSWEQATLFLRDTYFYGFFVRHARKFDLQGLDPAVVRQLQAYVWDPDFDAAELSRVSLPCGALARWVAAVFAYGRGRQVTSAAATAAAGGALVEAATIQDLTVEIGKLTSQLEFEAREMAGIHQKVSLLQADLERQLAELKDKYDRAMDALQESFFDAHGKFQLACRRTLALTSTEERGGKVVPPQITLKSE